MNDYDLNGFLEEKSPGFLQLGGARMALLDIKSGYWGIRRQMESLVGNRLTDSVLQQAGANGGASFAKSIISTLDQKGAAAFSACLQVFQSAGFGQFDITTMDWTHSRIIIRADQTFEAWMMVQNGQIRNYPSCSYTTGVLVGFINIIGDRKDVVCIETSCQGKGDEICQFELLPAGEAKDQVIIPYSPDPGLGRQINLLEMLFERMPMGIAILDPEYRIQRFNPTWGDFAMRYAPPSGAPLVPGINYFDHLPGTELTVMPLFERVLDGETIHQNGIHLESEGVETYWDIVLAPLVENETIVGILNVAVDASERVESLQNLEIRVEERTRQLRSLLQVSQDLTSTLSLEPLLELILDQLKTVVDYTGASVLLLEDAELVMESYRGPISNKKAKNMRFRLDEEQLTSEVIWSRKPIIISDVRSDAPTAKMFQQIVGREIDSDFEYIRSWLGVPLIIKGRVLGLLTLDNSQPDFFTEQHADLIQVYAQQVSIAIENARLYKQAEDIAVASERTRLARDLHDAVTQTLFSASLIAEVLPKIWDKNPDEGRRRLEEIRQLTRGALSEMRILLLELRPAVLIDTDLGDLIGHQVSTLIARKRLTVDYSKDVTSAPPLAVKEVFYRVAQESLNNIDKHSDATIVSVHLNCHPKCVNLVIKDNGVGFIPDEISTDNLGLGIMEERARGINAQFSIDGQRNNGTTIQLTWAPTNQEESNE